MILRLVNDGVSPRPIHALFKEVTSRFRKDSLSY
jgi:hypothetical protein